MVKATHHVAVAFKPNLAFFEQYGAEGWAALERVVESVPSDVLVIADAKRGDIGNTASRYARAMFEDWVPMPPPWRRTWDATALSPSRRLMEGGPFCWR